MAMRGGLKKELDPEELAKKKFHAKCLFRALGRLVMSNAYWLIMGVDHYEGFDNVKRRVDQAVRGKAKKTQMLSIKDKALLNKNAQERTDQEKKYIYRIIGGLKCFKRYPNNVKRKLAAVTYFKYYGPGRVIVRQDQEAHAMYFIISGEVTVSQLIFDELLKQYVPLYVGIMHHGDMFGEVSLLHNIPRTATVTTNDHCELLVLMKYDFKNVLQFSVQKQWDEISFAMSAFTYFNRLDEVSRREGCIVAKLKSYDINETLLGDGVGIANYVYFILSGQCQMIESIQVNVATHLGKKYYTLYDPYVPKEESEQDLDAKYFKFFKQLNSEEGGPDETINEEAESSNIRESRTKSILHYIKKDSDNVHKTDSDLAEEDEKLVVFLKKASQKDQEECIRISVIPQIINADGSVKPMSNIRTYFMQICKFNAGASFGFGENMRDRRIVALTNVSCLLLPKIWLVQRNSANIWSRIQYFLDKKIPNKNQLFKEFLSTQRWQEFRESLVEDVISRSNTVNCTSNHDVPYSIRMEETQDIANE